MSSGDDSPTAPTFYDPVVLGACNPPNNHALYQFIHHNAGQFDPEQRRSIIRLVTWPVRDTDRLADVLGWVALKTFPDAIEIQQMWSRWIRQGAFDGGPSSPEGLARYLMDSHAEGLLGWERVNEALINHVRDYVRSGEKQKVFIAMEHVRAAADTGTPVLASLLRETEGVPGSEWGAWRAADPDEAEWMEWYVFHISQEAKGDRNWLRALEGIEDLVAFGKLRRRMLQSERKNQ